MNFESGVSEETARARRLQQAQAQLAAIVESSDDAIVSKTLKGIVQSWNIGAQRIFGYTADEMIGQPIDILFPPDRKKEEPAILARICAGERVDHFETIRVRKDGTLLEVSVTISPVRDHTGKIIGASKIARDITAQKRLERELHEARLAAETANRAKDDFLSILSHELRTPLSPALGALSMLETRSEIPADVREELQIIRRNVETEARLVDDLLDVTRISRGKIELRFELLDTHGALRNTLAMFQSEIIAKQLQVQLQLDAGEHFIWADSGRLQQVFLNLLSNAVKFTPRCGRITISSSNPLPNRIRVEFSDTGIGIEQPLLATIFRPFEQGETTVTRRYGGLGLGLAITRSLVEMHHGSVAVTSPGPGKGATFTLEFTTLPASAQRDATRAAANKPQVKLRILLVEDHADTRRVMIRLLESFGCTVAASETVAGAVALAEAQPFDLVISDIGLPDGTGVELLEQVRRTQPSLRGIAISGFGQTADLQRSLDAGYDAHLVKPINFQSLRETLEKFVPK